MERRRTLPCPCGITSYCRPTKLIKLDSRDFDTMTSRTMPAAAPPAMTGSGGGAASARGAPDSHSKHYRQCWLFSVANHASPFGESTAYVGVWQRSAVVEHGWRWIFVSYVRPEAGRAGTGTLSRLRWHPYSRFTLSYGAGTPCSQKYWQQCTGM